MALGFLQRKPDSGLGNIRSSPSAPGSPSRAAPTAPASVARFHRTYTLAPVAQNAVAASPSGAIDRYASVIHPP